MPIRRPRVLRPQHLRTAGGAGLGADQGVFHWGSFDSMVRRQSDLRRMVADVQVSSRAATPRPVSDRQRTTPPKGRASPIAARDADELERCGLPTMPQPLSLRTFTPVTWKYRAACSMWRSFV